MSDASEPEYLAQVVGCLSPKMWIDDRLAEARAEGCTFFRASFDEHLQLTLLEGWRVQPADQGEPRFQVALAQ